MASKHTRNLIPATIILIALIFSSGAGRVFYSETSSRGENDGIINSSMDKTGEAVSTSPVILWVSDPVRPGEVVMATGADFGDSPQVELSWLTDNKPGQPSEGNPSIQKSEVLKPLQVTTTSVKFLIPATWKEGVYTFQVSSGGGSSKKKMVNDPDPWWQQGDWGKEASPGGWLRIFGKCLSLNGKATVSLQGKDHTYSLIPSGQDMYSLNLTLPENIVDGEYETWVHNGCGGSAGWKQVGIVKIKSHSPLWKPDTFDIRNFGAACNDGFDDGYAIQSALDAADRNGGGIVFIPRGRFQVNTTLMIPRFVLLSGESADLSQLYWRDRRIPLDALILGTNSFGIEDLTIIAGNHLAGIVSDPGTAGRNPRAVPGQGNVFLRRLHMRLNRFERVEESEIFKRLKADKFQSVDRNLCAILIDGENIQVTDCEIYSSQSPFRFNGNNAIFRNNHCFEGGISAFISGKNIIFEDNCVEGGILSRGLGQYVRENLYYARNRIGNFSTADAEIFTSDQFSYSSVGFISAAGTKIILDQVPDWEKLTGPHWGGNETFELYLFITRGRGMGQSRRIKSYQGREVELDRPWDIPPDNTSSILLSGCHMHNLLIGNEFHDGSIVQCWFMGVEWILAGNKITRGGGMQQVSRDDAGWYFQFIGNEILTGSGTRGPWNERPPRYSHLNVNGTGSRSAVFRRNVLHNNSRITIGAWRWDGPSPSIVGNDIVIDHNFFKDADEGISLPPRSNGILLWKNHFERIKEPVVRLSDKVFMHPAERLLTLLSAEGVVPAVLQNHPEWKTLYKRLEDMTEQDPMAVTLPADVRKCQDKLLQTAAAALPEGISISLLRALTGLTITETSSAELGSILAKGNGGTATTSLSFVLPVWSVPITITANLPLPGGWKTTPPEPVKLKPGDSVASNITVTIPSGIWGKPSVPLTCKVDGEGWKLNCSGRLKLAALSKIPTELINQWMIAGPFTSDQPGVLGDTLYPPQLSPDIHSAYPSGEGPVHWQAVKKESIDFTQFYGQAKNGVAFALAVLRVNKTATVAITTNGNNTDTYLNGELLGLPEVRNGNFKASVTLPAGNHVLLYAVPMTYDRWNNTPNPWRLSVQVETGPGTTEGDVELVPVEKFGEIPALTTKASP